MVLRARCPNPHCRQKYRFADGLGRRVVCRKCGREFRLGEAAEDTTEKASPDQITPPPLPVEVRAETPTSLGRFEIRSRLGAGAFGVVYRAYDPLLDREVALKVPHAGRLETDKDKARFVREAKAAAKLRHPNVVPVYEAGVQDGHHYLASAFIEGQTLRESIEARRPDFQRAARLVRDLAGALFHAHRQGVVHRDIKPANIILDGNGDPLVMDFGLARFQEGAEKLTHDGTLLGTPAYMPPEQAMGKLDEVGPASDQYSLGVVFYELLCGETPFSGPPPLVISHVINQEPPRPRGENAAIPRDLETICLKAMAKRPEKRYTDCGELAEDLRRWESGDVIHARRVGPVERLLRWCRRSPVLAALSASTVLLLLVVATITTIAYFREAELRQNTEQALAAVRSAEQEAQNQRKAAADRGAEAHRQQKRADGASRDAETRLVELEKRTKELEEANKRIESEKKAAVVARQAAESERNKAQAASLAANTARQQAEKNLAEAERQRMRAEERDRLNRLQLYASDMNHAMQALEEKDFNRVERILEQHSPKTGDDEDLRTFEWYYLANQCGFHGHPRAGELAVTLQHRGPVYRVEIAHDGSAFASVGADEVPRVWQGTTFRSFTPKSFSPEALQAGYLIGLRPTVGSSTNDLGCNGCEPQAWSPGRIVWAGAAALPAPAYRSVFIGNRPQVFEDCVTEGYRYQGGQSVPTPVYHPFQPFRQVVVEAAARGALWTQPDCSEPLGFSTDSGRLALTKWALDRDSHARPVLRKLWQDMKGVVTLDPPKPLRLPYGESVQLAKPHEAYVCSRADAEIWDVAKLVKVVAYDIRWTQPVFSLLPACAGSGLAVIEPPHHFAFDQTGRLAATDGRTRTAAFKGKVSVLALGTPRCELSLFPDSVGFSPDGKLFLGYSSGEHVAEIVDVATATVRRIENLPGTMIAVSPDAKLLATWYEATAEATSKPRPLSGTMAEAKGRLHKELDRRSNTTIELRELSDGRVRGRLYGHKYAVRAAAFSPDGKTLATGSDDASIKLWDVATGLEKCTLKGHTDGVLCLAFSNDGTALVSGSRDGTMRIWQAARMGATHK